MQGSYTGGYGGASSTPPTNFGSFGGVSSFGATGATSVTDAPRGGGAGGASIPPSNSPPGEWDHNNVTTLPDNVSLPKFDISEACGNSLSSGVSLLNKLGRAWPHEFATVYSTSTSKYWLLAKVSTTLSISRASKAHDEFMPDEPEKKERKIRSKEDRQNKPLEQRLCDVLVGQRGAIRTVSGQIRRKENGWHSAEHPLVFLFLGSSGIGKTALAKEVAKYLHDDDKESFIRLDMTEYQHQHEVSKFIGAPPGYLGYDEAGQLTKRLKKYPDAVVLFDEVDKAHPDILTCLLQTFDEGRLTDGKGETVECMDAVFVMTSNLAQTEIADEALRAREEMKKLGRTDYDDVEPISNDFKTKVVQPILKNHFKRDEFIGRITEILFFLPFTAEQLQKLARDELMKWKNTAMVRHEMKLLWDGDVEKMLMQAYNLRYGARSIQHEVERKVVSKLAKAHERDHIGKGSTVKLCVSPECPTEVAMYLVDPSEKSPSQRLPQPQTEQ